MLTKRAGEDPKAREVQRHFEVTVADFESIYTGQKSALGRWLDRTLRKDMFLRFDETLRVVRDLGPVSVLDIGCGNGVYAVALARQGAREVVGIDFSQPMIDRAIGEAAAAGVAGKCRFVVGDFRLLNFPDRFDCSIAIGVFDYLAAPLEFLMAMRDATKRTIVATFPYRWTYRAPIRKVRLGLQGCPVYFYSKTDVRRLFRAVGAPRLTIRRMGHILFVVAEYD
jgi:SAM-dependent methyltransferase